MLRYFNLFTYVDISLFNWVYCISFFNHYIEQNMFSFILKQSLEDLLQNRCSRSILNKLRYACESLLFLLKFQAIGYSCRNFTKIEPLHWYFFKDFDEQPPEMLLEISQNSQENACARVSFLKKYQKRDYGTCVFL